MTSPSDHIAVLGLPTRIKNMLLWNQVETVGQLLNQTPRDFRMMMNIGPKSVADIYACLDRHNLKARDGSQ